MKNEDYIGEYDIVAVPDGDPVLGTLGIGLGFLTHNDSYSIVVYPGDGHLLFDGSDIYFIDKNGKERQSHTVNYAIEVWLEQGLIARRQKISVERQTFNKVADSTKRMKSNETK